MTKHGYNERWRCGDKVYKDLPDPMFKELYKALKGIPSERDRSIKSRRSYQGLVCLGAWKPNPQELSEKDSSTSSARAKNF